MTVQYQGVWTLQSAAQLQSTQRWVTDPLFENTTLLLQADDAANGAQNNTFLDSSSNNFTITRNGNTTQGSFTPFSLQPGAWGNFFDGSNSFIQRTSPPAGITDWTSTNWTLEYWIYANAFGSSANTGSNVFGNTNDSGPSEYWSFGPISTGAVRWYYFTGASPTITTTTTLATGRWYHLAFVNNGGNLTIYIDGVSSATGTIIGTPQFGSAVAVTLGKNTGSSFNGYVSNLRITQSAVYTANFTPSALPLTAISGTQLLMCQSNRFVDNSTNAIVFTPSGTPSVQAFSPFAPQYQWTPSVIGGSGYFDGTGDSLTVPTSTANAVESGSFYFEAWVYLTNPSVAQMIIADPANTGGLFVGLNIDGGGRFAIGRTAVAVDNFVNLTWFGNSWYHLAVNRNGTSLQFFVNGTQVGSTGTNSVNYPSRGYRVGAEQAAGSAALTGFISGLRLVKSSVNTTNFTPPTAPPTAITNTALLLNFTNAGIYDGTMKNNLETVGNAQISTAVVKYGSGSMAFDGSGDYLRPNSGNIFNFGTGDFTVEFWLYLNSTGNQTFIDCRPGSAGDYMLFDYSSNALRYYVGSTTVITGSSLSTGQWYHIALSRISGTARMFINGTQTGSTATHTTNLLSSSNPYIASNYVPGDNLNGYIDDLRITKGIARYTQNFIPPSVALPRQ